MKLQKRKKTQDAQIIISWIIELFVNVKCFGFYRKPLSDLVWFYGITTIVDHLWFLKRFCR